MSDLIRTSQHLGCSYLLVSIRAYGAQASFKEEISSRIDRYTHMNRLMGSLNRWIGARIDLLGTVYFTGLAAYLIYGPYIGASDTGFILNTASDFSLMILLWVRFFNDFEVEANRCVHPVTNYDD